MLFIIYFRKCFVSCEEMCCAKAFRNATGSQQKVVYCGSLLLTNSYLMSVTEIFYSTSGCIKKAALIIGRQPGSEIYVLGDKKKRCRYSITVFTKFFTTAVYVSWPNQNSKYTFKLPSHSLLIVDNFLVNYRCLKLWHNYNKKLWIIWTWDFSIAKLNLFSQLFQQFFYSWMVMVN